jgi:hypothetical protein
MEKLKTLNLSLKKQWFDLMVTGEKTEEFRKGSDWIRSRLFNPDGTRKKYDVIKFVNGYGGNKPYFICKYINFIECYFSIIAREYSNGLRVEGIGKGDFIIICGDIIEKGNLKP